MKKKTLVFTTLIAAMLIASCKKEEGLNVNPAKPDGKPVTEETTPTQKIMNRQVYGVDQRFSGTFKSYIYSINYSTGAETNQRQLTISGGTNIGTVQGIAMEPTGNYAILSVAYSAPGVSVKFFRVDVTQTGTVITCAPLGLGALPVTDIEYNLITGKLYGISGNDLVRIDDCGSSTIPATMVDLGPLNTISGFGANSGPYAITFDPQGNCNIISGITHQRALVNVPSTPVSGIVISSGPYNCFPGVAPFYAVSDISGTFCSGSGTTAYLYCGMKFTQTSTSAEEQHFYHWTGVTDGLGSQLGDTFCADYTCGQPSGLILH